ncbi:MAG: hypothetical protein ACRD1M_09645 [Terriglobales bacterium]
MSDHQEINWRRAARTRSEYSEFIAGHNWRPSGRYSINWVAHVRGYIVTAFRYDERWRERDGEWGYSILAPGDSPDFGDESYGSRSEAMEAAIEDAESRRPPTPKTKRPLNETAVVEQELDDLDEANPPLITLPAGLNAEQIIELLSLLTRAERGKSLRTGPHIFQITGGPLGEAVKIVSSELTADQFASRAISMRVQGSSQ